MRNGQQGGEFSVDEWTVLGGVLVLLALGLGYSPWLVIALVAGYLLLALLRR